MGFIYRGNILFFIFKRWVVNTSPVSVLSSLIILLFVPQILIFIFLNSCIWSFYFIIFPYIISIYKCYIYSSRFFIALFLLEKLLHFLINYLYYSICLFFVWINNREWIIGWPSFTMINSRLEKVWLRTLSIEYSKYFFSIIYWHYHRYFWIHISPLYPNFCWLNFLIVLMLKRYIKN